MHSRLPFKTWLYFLAQSINLTTAVMSVSMAAFIGASLAPTPHWATVPYGVQFLFVMLMTWPAAKLMTIIGRKKSFLIASIPLALSGFFGYVAIEKRTFFLLIISHGLLGIYIAFANFNRFAATDGLAKNLKPKAISLVVAGGVVAAIIGPSLTSRLKDFDDFSTFAACYLAFVVLAALSIIIHLLLKENTANEHVDIQNNAQEVCHEIQPRVAILKNKNIMLAMSVAAIGYGIMNLMMIQASLYMSSLDFCFSNVSSAIQWHVLAMFIPSFFTGSIIQKIGVQWVIFSGTLLLIASCITNIYSTDYYILTSSLVLLGLGWNFTYIGGSGLLAQETGETSSTIKIQGIHDLCTSVMATLGAFLPAILLSWLGWEGTNMLIVGVCFALLGFSILASAQDMKIKFRN